MYVTNLCDRGKIKHGSQYQRTHSNGFKAVHSVVWESQSSSDHPTWTHKKQVPLAELTRREGSQQVRRERRHSSLIQHLWVSFGSRTMAYMIWSNQPAHFTNEELSICWKHLINLCSAPQRRSEDRYCADSIQRTPSMNKVACQNPIPPDYHLQSHMGK